MFENHNAFPFMSGRRALINKNSIKLEMLISSEDSTYEPYWFRSGEFSRYVKFYFLVVKEETLSEYRYLFNENTRVAASIQASGMRHGVFSFGDFFRLEKEKNNSLLLDYKVLSLAEILQMNNELLVNLPASDISEHTINDTYFAVSYTHLRAHET